MAMHKTLYTNPDDRTLRFERVFDAPRALIWKVWTDPAHVAKWWGPEGFTNSIHHMDVKAGGTWSLTMHGPDGTDYPNHIEFAEVRAPEFLAFHHGGAPGDAGAFYVTAEFVDVEGLGRQTRIIHTLVLKTAAQAAAVKPHAEPGHETSWARLEKYLELELESASRD